MDLVTSSLLMRLFLYDCGVFDSQITEKQVSSKFLVLF